MKNFIRDALERALKTAAQVAIASVGTAAIVGDVDWLRAGSMVLLATILSLLSSIASMRITGGDSASLVRHDDKE